MQGAELVWFCCVSRPTARGRKSAKCCDLDQQRASCIGHQRTAAKISFQASHPVAKRHFMLPRRLLGQGEVGVMRCLGLQTRAEALAAQRSVVRAGGVAPVASTGRSAAMCVNAPTRRRSGRSLMTSIRKVSNCSDADLVCAMSPTPLSRAPSLVPIAPSQEISMTQSPITPLN